MMPNMGMPGMQMPGMMPMNNMGQQNNNTWSDATSKVNISLDGLSPAAKMKQSNMPAMNQMGSGPIMWYPGVPMMSPVMPQGVVGLSQGISNMGMPGMGSGPQPMMNNMGNMGMNPGMNPGMNQMNQGQMMTPGMGMQMTMSNNMTANATFQNRTDSAFSAFGNLK